MRKFSTILSVAIAALLITGAAICAAAQSRNVGKKNGREQQQPAAQDADKQQEQTPARSDAVKHNKREIAAPQAASDSTASAVRYSYEFTQPKFYIRHIVISHDENGRGQISFERKEDDVAIVDPIELSPATLQRVKALWDTLKFLDSQTDYQSERQMAHLGTMRLGMKQGERERVAEFNWTNDPAANTLVNEYRRAADQALFVFNISVARQNQPLEAPKLMDELDKMYKRKALSDPQQLVPLLRELSNDERIPLIARNHAIRLLKQIEKEAARKS